MFNEIDNFNHEFHFSRPLCEGWIINRVKYRWLGQKLEKEKRKPVIQRSFRYQYLIGKEDATWRLLDFGFSIILYKRQNLFLLVGDFSKDFNFHLSPWFRFVTSYHFYVITWFLRMLVSDKHSLRQQKFVFFIECNSGSACITLLLELYETTWFLYSFLKHPMSGWITIRNSLPIRCLLICLSQLFIASQASWALFNYPCFFFWW